MKYIAATFAVCALCGVMVGCGGSDEPSVSGVDSGTQGEVAYGGSSSEFASPSHHAPDAMSPAVAVGQFYEALRSGSKEGIARLLTDKARAETAKNGLGIRSSGSASLKYQLGEIDYVTEQMDGAHVKSIWTEVDDQGGTIDTEVIWVLRKQQDGWRIAGMATQVMEGQLPLLFNFEDPQDMLQKKNFVENELTTQPDANVQQASHAEPYQGQVR